MPTQFAAKVLATLVFGAIATMANAGEVPASFDAKSCKADYPKAALMNEEQGVVSMMFLVSAEGRVLESKLEKTSGYKNLDKAAMAAVTNCKFKPGSKDGKPDSTWTKVDYAWSLS